MKKYISIIAAVVLTVSVTSCKKDFLSLEANPNLPSATTPQLILAGALTTVPNITENNYIIYDVWSAYWSWNAGVVPPASIFQYQFTNTDFSPNIWNNLYANATNFNTLITTSAADPSLSNFQAIGMIMKVWDFENLVDNFGDVPYSQAFKPSTILFPAYDKGVNIYTDLGKQLDAAIALTSKGGTNPGSSDTMFGGDMTKWKALAYTLKLRLAIRLSNVYTSASSNPLVAGLPAAGSAYLSTDALINPGYLNTAGQQNPYYGGFVKDANGNTGGNANVYRANSFSIKFLKNTHDSVRMTRMFSSITPTTQSNGSHYYGNVYGDAINILGTQNVSGAGPAYAVSSSQSSIFMLASESYLLQAEAAVRGYITGDDAALFTQGVTADFTFLGLTAADATTYLNGNPYVITSADTKIQSIVTEKWVSFLNGYDGFEAFNEYRRTGYPNLPTSVDPAAKYNHLPYRLYYPSSEASANVVQYLAAGADKVDPATTKIFWAK